MPSAGLLERTIIRLRSRLVFLKDGDANTKLFHLQCSHRTQKKHISKLVFEGRAAFTQDEMAAMMFSFFSSSLGSASKSSTRIDLAALGIEQADLAHLDYPFYEEEVWNTIKALPKDKSPGSDGFTAEFYQVAWPTIKHDVMRAFSFFYETNKGQFHKLNGALITLIPKRADAISPADYRPISLIHSFGKLVAKTLANRLAPALHSLVDVNRSAFIKTRSIHDNFKLVELAAKALHKRKKASLLLKL